MKELIIYIIGTHALTTASGTFGVMEIPALNFTVFKLSQEAQIIILFILEISLIHLVA